MFRTWSETLVDALGIAKPKYEAEIRAYEEMKHEHQQNQHEVQQLYATWKPPLETTMSQYQPPSQPPIMTSPSIPGMVPPPPSSVLNPALGGD